VPELLIAAPRVVPGTGEPGILEPGGGEHGGRRRGAAGGGRRRHQDLEDLIGRPGQGRLAPGAAADLVWLGDDLRTRATWVAGERVYPAGPVPG